MAWNEKLLLHHHRKLDLWLPCGGHVEPGEAPDEAAIREVYEESGVRVQLLGDTALAIEEPRQLVRPRGVQVEQIGRDHQHIDFIYFARPVEPYDGRVASPDPTMRWYSTQEVASLPLNDELRQWSDLVLRELLPLTR